MARRRRRRLAPLGGEKRRHGVPVASEDLRHAGRVVEADEGVRDDETALGQAGALVWERHRRLELRHMVVGEVADDGISGGELALGVVEVDEAGAAADEAVASEPALLDRLEEEGRAALGG